MSWSRIRGHDALIEGFDRAVRRGRLAHAYLFTGPPGVGKRLFAGELAKALLCEDRPNGRLEACDRCSSCRLIESGAHPNFFVAGRPTESPNIPIEVIRELSRSLALKPGLSLGKVAVKGARKVAILDDADDLNDPITGNAAANAFLKTLEEPYPGTTFLLIGTDPERQLPTIVSRCQVVRFAPLPEPLVAELLREQGIEDAAQVERLARLSGGSLGRAKELADPALWEFRGKLLQELTRPQVDSVGLSQAWMRFVDEAGKESAAQRRRAALALQLLIDFLKDALTLSVGGTPKLVEADDSRALGELVKRANSERLLELLECCLAGDEQNDRRVQLVLVLEALVDALGRKVQT